MMADSADHPLQALLQHPGFVAAAAKQERIDLERLHDFALALECEDAQALQSALCGLQGRELWPVAARIAQEFAPSHKFRLQVLEIWITQGHRIREEFIEDLVLLNFLRALLPRYEGGPRRLYRSEHTFNVPTATWGMSWTSDIATARAFSGGPRSPFPGGTVIVEARAPKEAIICRVPRRLDVLRQREFIVDRRLLGPVKVVRAFGRW